MTKKHVLRSPVSINYKIVLESQKTFKMDGEIKPGKKVIFRNGLAEVDEETLAMLKERPEWGVDFMEYTEGDRLAQPVTATPKGFASENEKELDRAKMDMFERKMDMFGEVLAQIVDKLGASDKKGG